MEQAKKLESLEVINLVECEGAICVSVGNHKERYYADNIDSRQVKFKKYRNETN